MSTEALNPYKMGALRFLMKQAGKMDFDDVARYGNMLGNAMWRVLPSRRRYTTQCVAERLGLSGDAATALAHESFRQNARSFLELAIAPKFGFALRDSILDVDDAERLERFMHCERPVVGVTAHIGGWELLAGLIGDFYSDRPRMIVVRRNKSPELNRMIMDQRGARGASILDHRRATFTVLKGLKRNGLAAFLVDHNTSRSEATFLPFLGKQAAVNIGPALLALRANALVWPIFLVRTGERFMIHTEEPLDPATLDGDRDSKVQAICAFYTQAVERIVRAYPEQWFWMHKRWKTRPPEAE